MGGLAAFILLSIFSVIQTLEDPKQIPLAEAGLGDTVTLTCNISGHEKGLFYWYKLNFGYMEQTVAHGTFGNVKLERSFNKSNLNVTVVGDVYFLTIKNVSKKDEATYFCQAGTAYTLEFVNGTHLAMIGSQTKNSVYVTQSSAIGLVPLGTTVTLQCLLQSGKKEKSNPCDNDSSVFWFRAGSQSDSGFIYTDKMKCAERSCNYRLNKTIQNPSDAGTYHCAVVTCGEILFGEGTKVETRQNVSPLVIVLGVLLGCSVLLNFTLILIRRKQKQVSDYSKGEKKPRCGQVDGSAEDQTAIEDGEEDGINYVALNFSTRRPTRWKREASEESTYSNIQLSVKGSVREK